MKLESLKKSELVKLLTEIQNQVAFLEKAAASNRKDYESTSIGVYLGVASGYEQAAEFINEIIDKYTKESTRP